MTEIMTTKMSSKGQVVLPEALRHMYGLQSGTVFTVIAYKGSIIMQPVRPPTDDEIASEFEKAFEESRRQAREAGMMPVDVSEAIAEVRSARRMQGSQT